MKRSLLHIMLINVVACSGESTVPSLDTNMGSATPVVTPSPAPTVVPVVTPAPVMTPAPVVTPAPAITPAPVIIPNADVTEFLIEDAPNYESYLVCGTTVNVMTMAYWTDHGYPTLIPGGGSAEVNPHAYAFAEESSFFDDDPSVPAELGSKTYYAQAAEYGNNLVFDSTFEADTSFEAYKSLIDAHQTPVYIGWREDEPFGGPHATLGVGYRIEGDKKYFLLYDTFNGESAEAISYDDYGYSVRSYSRWHPISESGLVSVPPVPTLAASNISVSKKEFSFGRHGLKTETYAYHDFEYGDINGDGHNDLVIVNFRNYTAYPLRLAYGNGTEEFDLDSTFFPAEEGGAGLGGDAFKVAKIFDVEGDGDLDIVTAGYWADVAVFENHDTGVSEEYTYVDGEGRGFIDLDYGDIDNDGDLDIVASVVDGVVRVYLNDNGTFTQSQAISLGTQSFKVRLIDIDNDKELELIASLRAGIVAVLDNDSGVIADAPLFLPTGHGGMSFDVADINSDGWKDIVTVNDGQLLWYLNNNGSFTDDPIYIQSPSASPKDIVLSDLNSDGLPELFIANFKGHDFILENTGGGFNENPFWASDNDEPSFSASVFDVDDNTKMFVFGKSRGGTIEFFEVK